MRLMWSVLLSGAMIGTFKYFEGVKVLTETEKNVFNMCSTGIYLTIGLNLAVSAVWARVMWEIGRFIGNWGTDGRVVNNRVRLREWQRC